MKNFDSYYDPPDDDPVCEDGCGETLHHGEWSEDWYCTNKFCPLKFQGVEQEMAYKLVETLQDLAIVKRKVNTLRLMNGDAPYYK